MIYMSMVIAASVGILFQKSRPLPRLKTQRTTAAVTEDNTRVMSHADVFVVGGGQQVTLRLHAASRRDAGHCCGWKPAANR